MGTEKSILITSLSNQGDRKSHRYFYFEESGAIRYCDGLSVGEAGAKYILSHVDIDEIIVLGAGLTYEKGEEMKPLILREWSDFDTENPGNLSEYSFFQYRIAQFLDGLDLEAVDVLEEMDEDVKNELLAKFQKFGDEISGTSGYRPDRVFHMIAQDSEIRKQFFKYFPNLPSRDLLWLKRVIYTQLSDQMKLSTREDNTDIRVCFIPTGKDQTTNHVPAQNVSQIVSVLNNIEADVLNVYLDMQGLDSAEGYTFLAVLSMLSQDPNNHIQIREIITSHYRSAGFANPIDNDEMKRYDINLLVSGMSAFVRYGKVDEVETYWESRGIQNDHIELLLYAMRRVDEGISLCNISDLEFGINLLKDVFRNTPREELPDVESNIFRILEETIRMDYGPLLEGDELDELELVKWSLRKKFYQQCLTIIESRLPTDYLKKGILYYAKDEESKQKYLEELNGLYWDYAPKDRWNFNDLAHYFIKYYGRAQFKPNPSSKDRQKDFTAYRVSSLEEGKTALHTSYTRLGDRLDLLEKALYQYYRLGDIRNQINHAEDTPGNSNRIDVHSKNANLTLLLDGVNAFIAAYEEALNYLKTLQDDYTYIEITQDELKEYTSTHKIFKEGGGRRNNYRSNNRRNDRRRDGEQRLPEGEMKPAEGEVKPVDGEVKPAEGDAKPMEGGVKPAEGEKPAEGAAAETKPEGIAADASASAVKTAEVKPHYNNNNGGGYYRNNRYNNNRGFNRDSNSKNFTVTAGGGNTGKPLVKIVVTVEE